MKTKITIEIDHENDDANYEITAINDRHKNKMFVDDLYNQVFRPEIKYKNSRRYQDVWNKIAIYMQDLFDE